MERFLSQSPARNRAAAKKKRFSTRRLVRAFFENADALGTLHEHLSPLAQIDYSRRVPEDPRPKFAAAGFTMGNQRPCIPIERGVSNEVLSSVEEQAFPINYF